MTLGKLHMRIQGLKLTREKPLDIYLEGKRKKCSALHNRGP